MEAKGAKVAGGGSIKRTAHCRVAILPPLWLAKTRSGWSGAVASSSGRRTAGERRIGVIGTGWEVGSHRELQVWMW